MYRPALLIAAACCGTNIALVQVVAQAKTAAEIRRIAKNMTFRIETVGANNPGSGVLLHKQGDVYSVLTAAHVVKQASSCRLIAPDGKVYQSISVRKANENLDLAVVKFRSTQTYQIAVIATANPLEPGAKIYIAGFPTATRKSENRVLQLTSGHVTGNATKPNSNGYSLIYNSITLPGMSGGPIINEAGQLVAIQGQGDRAADGQKTGFNLGITIERFGPMAASLGIKPANDMALLSKATAPKAADFFLAGYEKNIKGENQGALADYNQAIELNPEYVDAYNNRGLLKEEKLNDPSGALADYNQAIELNSQYATAYYNRGNLKKNKLNDPSGALADYNQAIEINPNYAAAYYNRGNLKKDKLNDRLGALADYNQAIELNPQYATAYNNRGVLKHTKLNNAAGALADYNQAIEINPNYALAYYNRGNLKDEKLNDIPGAVADFSQAIKFNPNYADAYYNRGLLKKNQKKSRAAAVQDFRQAASLYRQQGRTADLKDAIARLKELGATE